MSAFIYLPNYIDHSNGKFIACFMDFNNKAFDWKENLSCITANWQALWLYKDYERLFDGRVIFKGIYSLPESHGLRSWKKTKYNITVVLEKNDSHKARSQGTIDREIIVYKELSLISWEYPVWRSERADHKSERFNRRFVIITDQLRYSKTKI